MQPTGSAPPVCVFQAQVFRRPGAALTARMLRSSRALNVPVRFPAPSLHEEKRRS